MHISITNIFKAYDDIIIFDGTDIFIKPFKKIGLIGPNGFGKSTLCNLISGKEIVDIGGIGISGDIFYLIQELDQGFFDMTVEEYILTFLSEYELYKRYIIAEELNIDINILSYTIGLLSGGQRKKLQLSSMVIASHDILLLDEPTNHLDGLSQQWLINYCKKYKGIIVAISHDRDFLNEWVTDIISIEEKKLILYHGNYDNYQQAFQAKIYNQQIMYDIQQRKIKKAEEWLQTIRQRASVYASPMRGRLLKNKEKFVKREFYNQSLDKPQVRKKSNLFIDGKTHQGKRLVCIEKESLQYENNVLIKDFSCEIFGKDRISLSGSNGSGKSTLIKYIISKNIDVNIGYFNQEDVLINCKDTILQRLQNTYPNCLSDEIWISRLISMGLHKDHLKQKLSQLSFGQRARIRLIGLCSSRKDLLILDEPTNHMDLLSIEAIEDMLSQYDGAILVISHDAYFLRQILINQIWEIKDNNLLKY